MTRDSGASEQLPPHPRFCPIFSPMGDVDDDDVYEDGDDNDDDDVDYEYDEHSFGLPESEKNSCL